MTGILVAAGPTWTPIGTGPLYLTIGASPVEIFAGSVPGANDQGIIFSKMFAQYVPLAGTVYARAIAGTSGAFVEPFTAVGASVSGSLSGSVNLSPTTPVNLTALAKTAGSDWAHWGYGSASGFDHKSNLISNVSLVGGATESLQYPSSPVGFTWTDGTPDNAVTDTTTFIYCAPGANGRGYSFTVPADQTVRTLLVWVAAYDDTMLFTATLSDGSAGPYSDSSVVSGSATVVPGLYTITYNAASAGQTLTVSVVTGSGGNTAAIMAAVLNT